MAGVREACVFVSPVVGSMAERQTSDTSVHARLKIVLHKRRCVPLDWWLQEEGSGNACQGSVEEGLDRKVDIPAVLERGAPTPSHGDSRRHSTTTSYAEPSSSGFAASRRKRTAAEPFRRLWETPHSVLDNGREDIPREEYSHASEIELPRPMDLSSYNLIRPVLTPTSY